jgi:hypothetical protein
MAVSGLRCVDGGELMAASRWWRVGGTGMAGSFFTFPFYAVFFLL